MITSTCAHSPCARPFVKAALNQNYCSFQCSRKAQRARRRERGRVGEVAVANHSGVGVVNDHVSQAVNPTVETLDMYAKMYLETATAKPMVFQGTIPPDWQPPTGVIWAEQHEGGMLMANESVLG